MTDYEGRLHYDFKLLGCCNDNDKRQEITERLS